MSNITGLMRLPDGMSTIEEVAELQQGLRSLIAERDQKLGAARRGLEGALAAPGELRRIWQQLVLAARYDSGESLHPSRDEWFRAIDWTLELIRKMIRVAPHAADLAGRPLAGAEQLPMALGEVEQFRERLAERWQTHDDLEELILAEVHPVTAAELSALAKKYPPPAAWYDETDDPFSPAE